MKNPKLKIGQVVFNTRDGQYELVCELDLETGPGFVYLHNTGWTNRHKYPKNFQRRKRANKGE